MFYLLMALLAPVCETVRALRRKRAPRQWPIVLRHFLLAAAILASMWLAAWGIGVILAWPVNGGGYGGGQEVAAYPRVIGRNMALFTLTTLAVVLTAVEIFRLYRRALRHRRRHIRLPEHRQPLASLLAAPIAGVDAAHRS